MMFSQLNFSSRRHTPVIRQVEASECGLACLAMVAGYHGLDTDLIALRRRFQTSLKGVTLKQLMAMAEELRFSGRPLRGEVAELHHLSLPVILHWDLDHFVVLTRVSRGLRGNRYHVHDPSTGVRIYSEGEIARRFTGVVLELMLAEDFQPQIDRTRLRINQLWNKMEGFWPAFSQIFFLSFILQVVALVTPFFLQISIDTVLPSTDSDLLLVLALGFAGVALVSMITTWVRSLVLLRLGTSLSYQVTVNLFRHLLRLPLPWFERRHIGDVVSRFGSTKAVSDLLSQGIVASLIDGIMAIATLILMFVYSPTLSFLALVALSLTVGLRFGFYATLKRANISMISTNARENSTFIETVRGMATLKAFGEETNRQRFWQQKKADAVNAEIATGRLNAGFNAGEQLVMALERVLFIYLAIRFSMTGALSVGMLFAMQSYRQQFLDATTRLVQQGINYRLLDMHLARIADIALSPPEPLALPGFAPAERHVVPSACIELRNVRFRYASNEPEILRGINLSIEPGEMIAFVGPSGGGKTTLMKIMMGLLIPTHGEVLVHGQTLSSYGVSRWRREIGSVAQDDALFSGSLADNICVFDPDPDADLILKSAAAANIQSEIERMPMRYHTPVGDMGSVLSGGQKQRVMLARAFYRRPSALFLDEATAHLDPMSEKIVGEVIQQLSCTRVVIAHRPQTIQRADRLFCIADGACVSVELISSQSSGGSSVEAARG